MSTSHATSTETPSSTTTPIAATWSSLPPETQLRILEHTDLIAPRRRIRWIAGKGFILLYEDNFPEIKGSWQSPQPLFLVNRTFHSRATDVFWRQNTFLTYPDTKAYRGPPGPDRDSKMPKRYAISEFLAKQLSPETLPSIRTLRTYFFGRVSPTAAEIAHQDWLQTVKYAISHGLNLSRLHINGFSFDGKFDEDDLEAALPSDENKFDWARRVVRDIVWPLTDAGTPPGISEQLFVKLTFDDVKIFYELRKDTKDPIQIRETTEEDERGKEMGRSRRGTRKISTSPGDGEETWIETVWVRILDPDEIE